MKLVTYKKRGASSIMSSLIGTQIYKDYIATFDKLPGTYIDAMIRDTQQVFDHRTGVRHDSISEKYFIGSSEITFNGSNIKVNNVEYEGTPGLYELLFKSIPKGYNNEDLKRYHEILDSSNAVRQDYNPLRQVRGSKSDKWRQIIHPLYYKKESVMLKKVTSNSIDYNRNDVIELVEQLRLLLAGNTDELIVKISRR